MSIYKDIEIFLNEDNTTHLNIQYSQLNAKCTSIGFNKPEINYWIPVLDELL
jgi:uncharacterized protein Smg (DUF494 family)